MNVLPFDSAGGGLVKSIPYLYAGEVGRQVNCRFFVLALGSSERGTAVKSERLEIDSCLRLTLVFRSRCKELPSRSGVREQHGIVHRRYDGSKRR